MGDASHSNCCKKQGSVSSVVGKLRSWDFVDAISVMIFISAEILNSICSTTRNHLFSKSMLFVHKPVIPLNRNPYISISTIGIFRSVPIIMLISFCICSIVYGSSVLSCLPNLVRISRAGLYSKHKWNWKTLQFHLCLTFALFTAYDFISNL